jgi:hypothetical protein
VDDAAGGADAQEVLRACEDACTNGCGVFVNDDTSMLLSTAQDFCFGECFPIE